MFVFVFCEYVCVSVLSPLTAYLCLCLCLYECLCLCECLCLFSASARVCFSMSACVSVVALVGVGRWGVRGGIRIKWSGTLELCPHCIYTYRYFIVLWKVQQKLSFWRTIRCKIKNNTMISWHHHQFYLPLIHWFKTKPMSRHDVIGHRAVLGSKWFRLKRLGIVVT